MSELANQIIDVFKKYKAWQDENLGAGHSVQMSTWNIRKHLEKEYKKQFTCADIRNEIKAMDAIKLDEHASRRGSLIWRYTA
ncbi:hypothetical protein [Yersinia proxima]|uniref:hypothetical protein n=1 Tax=Yersinia proxima TaxID=2890316 RepID=UPI001D106642|nr:hypothetical protein [Yersinia proxima]